MESIPSGEANKSCGSQEI